MKSPETDLLTVLLEDKLFLSSGGELGRGVNGEYAQL